MKPKPEEAARRIFETKFPEAKVIFLAGSVVRGEGTDFSDLDLVIVFDHVKAAWRDSFYFEGWPVEVFGHDLETLRYFFTELDYKNGIPSLAEMVTQGIEIPAKTGFTDQIKKMADETIQAGPPAWSTEDLRQGRYTVTDLCDDLRAPRSPAEAIASAVRLYGVLSKFYLRSRQLWSGSGKHIPKRLKAVDPVFAQKFEEAFQAVFSQHKGAPVLRLSEEVLTPYGGFLFESTFAECPADWRKA